ncbi:MAG TPA: hypothetical protein VHO24_10960 [Opitutaceae bacterium]|nr:hypothetical protein [Opitutaceae bacterium]
MTSLKDPFPIATDIIRTPVAGPQPANTLAFIQCRASGADIATSSDDLTQFTVEFKSKFQIDGYLQAKHDWYLANTFISATGMLRVLSTTTDFEFVIALDSVDPFIDLDGMVGFTCGFGLQLDGLGFFEKSAALDMTCNVCAYILLYEPVAERPPSGKKLSQWLYDPVKADEAIRIANSKRAERSAIAAADSRVSRPERRLKGPCHDA